MIRSSSARKPKTTKPTKPRPHTSISDVDGVVGIDGPAVAEGHKSASRVLRLKVGVGDGGRRDAGVRCGCRMTGSNADKEEKREGAGGERRPRGREAAHKFARRHL